MISNRPYLVLISLCIFVPIAFGITYAVSVGSGIVAPGFPYISDTGTIPPASCIFGQFLDIGAVLLFYISYVRYLHIKRLISCQECKNIKLTNKISFFIAVIASFGLTVVGNFQETNVLIVHIIGALMSFVGLLIYVWIQVFLSYFLSKELYSTKLIFIVRICLCIFGTLNMILVGIFTKIAMGKFDGEDALLWKPTDAGYVEHVLSTSNEWSLSIVIILVMATFYRDFKVINFRKPDIIVIEHSSNEIIPV